MTRTIGASLNTHKQGRVTTLARGAKIKRRDGVILGYTTHDVDVSLDIGDGDGSLTYESLGSQAITAVAYNTGLQADNLSVTGPFVEDAIDATDLRNGLYDFAEVTVFEFNWDDLTQGIMILFFGWWGQVDIKDSEFTVQFRPLTDAYSQHFGDLVQPGCRANLGDAKCKIPVWLEEVERSTAYVASTSAGNPGSCVRGFHDYGSGLELVKNVYFECTTAGTTSSSPVDYDPVVGNPTTDGTAVFTARNAWTRFGTVTGVTNRRIFAASITEPRAVDDWFTEGVVRWLTGDNAGIFTEVKNWVQSGGAITLYLYLPSVIQVGDTFEISPGCDLRHETCFSKFDNILNFRGEPFVPGTDVALDYPDAT